jgi:hypothetical protein
MSFDFWGIFWIEQISLWTQKEPSSLIFNFKYFDIISTFFWLLKNLLHFKDYFEISNYLNPRCILNTLTSLKIYQYMTTTMFHVHFLISKNFMKFKISLNRSHISKIRKFKKQFFLHICHNKVLWTKSLTCIMHHQTHSLRSARSRLFSIFHFHGIFTKKNNFFQWTLPINMNEILKWCSFKINKSVLWDK